MAMRPAPATRQPTDRAMGSMSNSRSNLNRSQIRRNNGVFTTPSDIKAAVPATIQLLAIAFREMKAWRDFIPLRADGAFRTIHREERPATSDLAAKRRYRERGYVAPAAPPRITLPSH